MLARPYTGIWKERMSQGLVDATRTPLQAVPGTPLPHIVIWRKAPKGRKAHLVLSLSSMSSTAATIPAHCGRSVSPGLDAAELPKCSKCERWFHLQT
eukprot:4680401-Amphidinium_carterae.1